MKVSPEKSTFIAYHLKLGRSKWTDLRHYLLSDGLNLSTWEQIRSFRNSFVPTFNWYPKIQTL